MTEKKQLQDIFLLREKKQTGEKNKQSLTIRNTKISTSQKYLLFRQNSER